MMSGAWWSGWAVLGWELQVVGVGGEISMTPPNLAVVQLHDTAAIKWSVIQKMVFILDNFCPVLERWFEYQSSI